MPRVAYESVQPRRSTRQTIDRCNAIIAEYRRQGYSLTLRQLYYQNVARGYIPNTERSYKALGDAVNTGRMCGIIDWLAIEDRTRFMRQNSHWDSPEEIIRACASQYATDKWRTQKYRPEVWIEKDALVGVIERVCRANDVPYFSCRGYTSQSEMWTAGQRMKTWAKVAHQKPYIIHLGDHDPSGIDMSRDIEERLRLFMDGLGDELEFKRIALNMDQVDQYAPPPNPAKLTDTRANDYIETYGDESWELDALSPTVIADLILDTINEIRDEDAWADAVAEEEQARHGIQAIADNYDAIQMEYE